MGQWKQSINTLQYITEESGVQAIKTAAAGVVSELDKLVVSTGDIIFSRIKQQFTMLRDTVQDENTDEDSLLEQFNHTMNDLYDWADFHRVWLAGAVGEQNG